jgi:predicted AlkP superfamily pyrophosphatase or phosphodiesterase
MPSSLLSLQAAVNPLMLPPVDKAVVLLVDGLGAVALSQRVGHARTLAPLLTPRTTIGSKFPTTTASALATLTTGQTPGVHGLVGYTALDSANDRVVNQLNGWDSKLDPKTWQRASTIFERATDAGLASFVVGTERYRSTGFTRAVLRGATYAAGVTIADRLHTARTILDANDRALVYVYVSELDQAGHAHGWQSGEWTGVLEEIDGAVRTFSQTLGKNEGLLVTADHGVLDVPASSHVLFDSDPGLIDGIRFVAGEPRALQLHFEPDASTELRDSVIAHWRETEGHRSWIVSRAEAIESGWFGPVVHEEVVPRIGDIIIAARKGIAYYDSRPAKQTGRNMIGQHGSWSPEESNIPLLRFGAYAG